MAETNRMLGKQRGWTPDGPRGYSRNEDDYNEYIKKLLELEPVEEPEWSPIDEYYNDPRNFIDPFVGDVVPEIARRPSEIFIISKK